MCESEALNNFNMKNKFHAGWPVGKGQWISSVIGIYPLENINIYE